MMKKNQSLLDFPDELLCDILIYLNGFDAMHSFFNLNKRLDRLLEPFQQYLNLTDLSYEDVMKFMHQFLPLITKDKPLRGIKLGNQRTPGQIDLFTTLLSDEFYQKYFDHINLVTVESPRLQELTEFVEKFLLKLQRLEMLTLKIDYIRDEQFQTWTKLIVDSILSISTLKKLCIDMPNGLVLSRLPETSMFKFLVDIRLNVTLITDLLILLPHIPNVEYLQMRITWWTSADRTLTRLLDNLSLYEKNQRFSLLHLRKFDLTIDSILNFQFNDLQRVLEYIMNTDRTTTFKFTLKNSLNCDSQLLHLIDGEKWETLLSFYAALKKFHLYIFILDSLPAVEEHSRMNSFKSKYFLDRQWFFSYVKYSRPNQLLIYSVLSKQRELFKIRLEKNCFSTYLRTMLTSKVLIDQKDCYQDPLNNVMFHKLMNHFPVIEELNLLSFRMTFSVIEPFYLSSLRRLKIDQGRQGDLFYLLQLLPFIDSLSIDFSHDFLWHPSSKLSQYYQITQFTQIIDLSVTSISTDSFDQALVFLDQFPNIHYLYIQIGNRRITNESLLSIVNKMIDKCRFLISFKLQLDKDVPETVDWLLTTNGRMKMYLRDTIFEGVVIHFWF